MKVRNDELEAENVGVFISEEDEVIAATCVDLRTDRPICDGEGSTLAQALRSLADALERPY